MDNELNIQTIKDRLRSITPFPWELGWDSEEEKKNGSPPIGIGSRADDGGVRTLLKVHHKRTDRRIEADLDFIAHAPEDISALIAEVERLRAVIKERE